MKELILLRGVPGAGKSTFAELLTKNGGSHREADKYFIDPLTQTYDFKPKLLNEAHEYCRKGVMIDMEGGEELIVVSNTFTTGWELEPYYKLAETYGYRVTSIVLENRHGGGENTNIHGVPSEKIEKMREKLKNSIKL